MEKTVGEIKVLLVVDGIGEASFYLSPSENMGTDVSVAVNQNLRPDALLGIMALALDSAMVHTRNHAELGEHWQDFQPMLRDVLELNELILSVTVELERLSENGGLQ